MSPDLTAGGPVVEVLVRVPLAKAKALLRRGRAVPAPVKVTAMIDTGATYSAFTPDVFERLGLAPFDESSISTSDGRQGERDTFDVDLEFERDGLRQHIEHVNSIASALNGCTVQGLIGRNLLKHAVLWYEGRRNQYSLTFG